MLNRGDVEVTYRIVIRIDVPHLRYEMGAGSHFVDLSWFSCCSAGVGESCGAPLRARPQP